MHSEKRTATALGFWLLWLTLATIALALAIYLSILLRQVIVMGTTSTVPPASLLYMALTPIDFWTPATILGLAFLSALIQFSLLGLAQWIALRSIVDISVKWIGATAMAAALVGPPFTLVRSLALSNEPPWFQAETLGVMNVLWLLMLGSATVALAISSMQWAILRKHSMRASWWIPASVLVAVSVFIFIAKAGLPYTDWRQAMLMGPLTSTFGVATVTRIAYTIPGFISQVITQALLGTVMLLLTRPRRKKQPVVASAA